MKNFGKSMTSLQTSLEEVNAYRRFMQGIVNAWMQLC